MTSPRTSHATRRHLVLVGLLAAALVGAACEPPLPVTVGAEPAPPVAGPPAAAAATPTDLGWEGPSFSGGSGAPSGSKPESKVWFHDGTWWADLWDTATNDFYVHRLDLAAHRWVRTPTRLDDRTSSRSDVLWDGAHLYVASHSFAEGSSSTPTGQPAWLRRFSYDTVADTYALDPGFPVAINDARTESLVIDEDSAGRIWATWVQDRRVRVAVSTVGGTSFAPSTLLPVAARVSADDISSVVAFAGDRIGVLWSNEDTDTMYFSQRLDRQPTADWGPAEVAFTGPAAADDHINLKSVADQGGRILAAVKTSRTGSATLIHLLDRDAATGTWTSHVYGLGTDNHTRPVVLVERDARRVHLFATSGQSGGSIYEKVAPLDAIAFSPGTGTPVLTDVSSADINNATSTKQAVDATTGLVVVATNDSTRQYWTHYDPLGGTIPPTSTTSSSSTSTTSTTSTTTPSSTSSTSTTTSAPSTTTTGQPGPGPVTFAAVADARVNEDSPTRNYGLDPVLRTRSDDPVYRTFLRFDVGGLTAPPTRAVLRYFVTDRTRATTTVHATDPSWAETAITWRNAPPPLVTVASSGANAVGTWVEIDVTAAVAGNGPVSLRLSSDTTDSQLVDSRETARPPQLVITP